MTFVEGTQVLRNWYRLSMESKQEVTRQMARFRLNQRFPNHIAIACLVALQ
jgi:hypothetical protein